MGERQSGGAAPGRRHAHPDGAVPGRSDSPQAAHDAALEALLSAAVLRGHRPDAESERRAVAAFRAARDAGAHRARTRRRDDWRPRGRRTRALSVRTTLSLFLASLTLGGVAVAALGSSAPADPPARGGTRPPPASSAPGRPATRPADPPVRPPAARDTEAECRAWDRIEGRGRAADSTAWRRLVAAAGGPDKVAAYCAGRRGKPGGGPARAAEGNTPGRGPAAANGKAGENAPARNRGGGSRPDRGAEKKN